MISKKNLAILILAVLLVVVGTGVSYFFFFQKSNKLKNAEISKPQLIECLNENEEISYKIEEKESPLADVIVFTDKDTKKRSFFFKIENIFKNYHPIELHSCGIYVIRFFNYDPNKTKQDPGFKVELWKYVHDGQGLNILLLSEKMADGTLKGDYSYDFRIDPLEEYLILEKSYLGKDDYSLVIKNLETKEDIFVLLAKEIFKQYPNIIGDFDMLEWTKDGRYFWGNVSDGAYVNGYFRIDTSSWKVDIYEAPQDVLGGDALNVEKGYITVHPGNVWYGFADMTEEEKAKRRVQGIGTELYIHNLFTGERQFIDKTTEPLWYFKPQWLSDTELQYELPTGEKKIYKINEN